MSVEAGFGHLAKSLYFLIAIFFFIIDGIKITQFLWQSKLHYTE